MMYPSSIAFWGASNNPMKMGTVQLANILETGFKGDVYPIHPTETTVLGLPAFKSISDVGRPVDLVQLTLPTAVVPGILEECGKAGIKRAVIISGGFKEYAGGGGRELEREIVEIARRYGIRFLGPNCVGIFNSLVSLNSTTIPRPPMGGSIGFASQSGAYTAMINPMLRAQGIKMCQTMSVGNEADVDLVDCLEYFKDEPDVKAIGLYVETIRRPREFVKAARETVKTKPVVAIYVGGGEAGSRSSLSHTGALTGPDEVYDGLFRQSGVIRADDIDQMLDFLWALSMQPLPPGDRIAVVTNSGGPGTSLAYHLEKAGMSVPLFSEGLRSRLKELTGRLAFVGNPVDLTFEMDLTLFEQLLQEIYSSGEVDGALLYGIFGWDFMTNMEKRFPALKQIQEPWIANYEKFLERMCLMPKSFGLPLFVLSFIPPSSPGIAPIIDGDVPVYPSARRAAAAMGAMLRYGRIAGSGGRTG